MFHLPDKEKEILSFWEKEDIFKKSLEARKGAREFVFYEGPPTANGKPGIHHMLARAYKDIVLRFKTMQGFYVPRRAGWDTHGLPVELEVEKKLGINSKKGIEEYGVEPFIAQAKESVWKYKGEWEEMTRRIGFWLDLEHPYITYETPYVESLWAIIKVFWEKGLLEESFKVVPWCYRCGTPLSSHELAQGYQKVTEPSFYVKFKLKPGQKIGNFETDNNTYIVSWTTTPWTLPGNVALAVGENIEYEIEEFAEYDEREGEKSTRIIENLIFAKESRNKIISQYASAIIDHKIKKETTRGWPKGKDLVGLSYKPLFDVLQLQSEKSYKIYAADFVNTKEGTGIVHTAVMYGEDDYQLGKKIGLPMVHTVTPEGIFVDALPEGIRGLHVKSAEAQNAIKNYLRQKGLLFAEEDYTHDYPFCWRCKSPLLYYATKSWFVRVTKVKEKLIANNQTIEWHPDYLKNGRFGNFLEEVKDWAFSRERYWGTPLPIWKCPECKHTQVIGSLQELSRHALPRNTFILVRHGQSENNLTHILSGLPEIKKYSLTNKGKNQAECLGTLLLQEKVDLIVASPVNRAKETANILRAVSGASLEFDERLREIDFGPFNGKKVEEYEAFWGSKEARFTKQGKEGMENFRDLKIRMIECLRDINARHEGKTIAIVTHRGSLWVLEGALYGLSDKDIAQSLPEDFESGEARRVYMRLPFNHTGEVDLHRPFIDEILLKCSKCKGTMRRIPEVADVWFDSGSMPFAQAHWPFDTGKSIKNLAFPADYIAEGIDQTRGWFYTLLAVSTLLGKGIPYRHVVSLGHLLDEKGRKMSKSLGNVIDPLQAIDQYGVDTIRWYFYVVNPPGMYKRFDPKEILSHQRRFLLTLFNGANFLQVYAKAHNKNVTRRVSSLAKIPARHTLDKWMISRLHSLTTQVSQDMEAYRMTEAARALEDFVDEWSNWYIRRSRERLLGDDASQVIAVLYTVLGTLAKLIAPFVPFSADILQREYLAPLGISDLASSVHLEDWPKSNKALINADVEKNMQEARRFVVLILAKRAANNIKVRQPLRRVTLNQALPDDFSELIASEVNVREVLFDKGAKEPVSLDTTIDQELLVEGFIREFIRQAQDLRKQAGLTPGQRATLWVATDSETKEILKTRQSMLQDRLAVTLAMDTQPNSGNTEQARRLNVGDKEITIGINVDSVSYSQE